MSPTCGHPYHPRRRDGLVVVRRSDGMSRPRYINATRALGGLLRNESIVDLTCVGV